MKQKQLLIVVCLAFSNLLVGCGTKSGNNQLLDVQNAYKNDDYAKVAKYEKGCNLGDATDCHILGDRYREGEGVQQNYVKAAKLYEKACYGVGSINLDGLSCFFIGLMYDNGQGVQQNHVKAANLYERACNSGDASGCHNLGLLYKKGQGVRQNFSTAKKYYGKACNLGYQKDCDFYKK